MEGVKVRRAEEETVLARMQLESVWAPPPPLPAGTAWQAPASWPIAYPAQSQFLLTFLLASDAVQADWERSEDELLLGPTPDGLLSVFFLTRKRFQTGTPS